MHSLRLCLHRVSWDGFLGGGQEGRQAGGDGAVADKIFGSRVVYRSHAARTAVRRSTAAFRPSTREV